MSKIPNTLSEFVTKRQSDDLSTSDVIDSLIDSLSDNPHNAFIDLKSPDKLRDEAKQIDEADDPGPLAGVPIAVKDNICTSSLTTTAGSRILKNFESPYEATVVEKLKEAGAIIIGKTNLDEFGMGASNEHSHFGPVTNPEDTDRVPGGSSGGSAAAISANLCLGALGSDTGGSVRQPASHCGAVGLKPTYGRVSRHGLIAFASSLDQIGPITHSVEDSARLLEVISGQDPNDATSVAGEQTQFVEALEQSVDGLTIGLPDEYFDSAEGIDEEVKSHVKNAVDKLEERGAQVKEISLPHTEYAISTYYLIATAEASSNLARYDGVRYGYRAEADDLEQMYRKTRAEGFGEEVKRRIMLGTYVLSAGYYDKYYGRAQKIRTLIRRDFESAFDEVDALITPTTPTTAYKLGEKTDDPLQMYLEDIFTVSANLAGLPAMSLPCGTDTDGLPIGLQILAPAFDEETLFQVGSSWETIYDNEETT